MRTGRWAYYVILLTTVIFINNGGIVATERTMIDYNKNILEINQLKTKYQDIYECYGEIRFITAHNLCLNINNRKLETFEIRPDAVIYCNGYRANWQALTPVTDGAYFEAKVYLNTAGEVLAIDGFYYGAECVVKSYRTQNQSKQITCYFPEQKREMEYYLSTTAVLPESTAWLRPGQVVFVLYNYKNEIRRVFLLQ